MRLLGIDFVPMDRFAPAVALCMTATGGAVGTLMRLAMGFSNANIFGLAGAAFIVSVLSSHGAGVGRAGWRGFALTSVAGLAVYALCLAAVCGSMAG